MTGRRTAVGLCLLYAALLSALAAHSAAASTKGTTAFTCRNEGPGHAFARAHCTPADATGGEYEHQPIAEGTTTSILGTAGTTGGEKVVTKLKYTLGGIVFEFQAKGLDLESSLTNLKDEANLHYAVGEGKITYTQVTATGAAQSGCKVKGEVIETKQLTLTTKGQEDALSIAPKEGETLAEFNVEGCTQTGLNGLYKLTGSVKGTPEGATLTFTHTGTTSPKTLRLNGPTGIVTGIEGSITLNGRDPALEETSFTPLSFTTVETP
jgi:hypothetical protein